MHQTGRSTAPSAVTAAMSSSHAGSSTHHGHQLVQIVSVQHTLHVAARARVRGVLELRRDGGLGGGGGLRREFY